MAAAGEAVVVDGLATRVQRPAGWANQKVLYDAKRHAHTAQGVVVSTGWGDLLWCDGGWPGSCHEHELIELSGLGEVLDAAGVASLLDRGSGGWPRGGSTGTHRSGTAGPGIGSSTPSAGSTGCRRGCGRRWSSRSPTLRRWRGLLYRVRAVYRAAGALVCLGRWLHRLRTRKGITDPSIVY
jgi:hypothetical protein